MLSLYHGSDAWRLREAARHFAATWQATYNARPLLVDGTGASAGENLDQLLKYPSLFHLRTAAVVYRPEDIGGINAILKQAHEDTDILLIQRTGAKPTVQEKKIVSGFQKISDVVEVFEPLTGTHLAAWVRAFTAQRDRVIEPAAVAELMGRAGNESWNLANELEKLCAYAPTSITVDAVRSLVPPAQKQDDWELSNAVAAHDKRTALTALFRRVYSGAPEPLLVGTLASAIRNLLMVRDLAGRGSSSTAIAKTTGLHPYVIGKALQGAARYTHLELAAAHRSLAELDRHSKEGKIDAVDGLFAAVLRL